MIHSEEIDLELELEIVAGKEKYIYLSSRWRLYRKVNVEKVSADFAERPFR